MSEAQMSHPSGAGPDGAGSVAGSELTTPDHGLAAATERPVDIALAAATEPPPVDITPDPYDDDPRPVRPDGRGGGPSRRRLIVLGSALVVALAGAAGLGTAGWRIAQQKDAVLDTPGQLAGLTRDDSDGARNTAEYLRTGLGANIDLDRSIGAVYADPADPRRSVLLAGGTALIWRPDRSLDAVFDLVADNEGAVAGLREVPAGDLGGVMKCGTAASEDGDLTVCGWADHGSVALAIFPGRTVEESAALLRKIRSSVQTRR